MKATRHNGRSGKNGTYNPRHNDRRFDLENSEHIDAGRVRENIYWDCYRGYTTMQNREEDSQDISFEKIECTFYQEHYGKYIEAQNERNARTRHTERNRSVEDLLKNNKTCPEETIFQIGTVEESVSYEILLAVVQDFTKQFTNRFGSHVHILDWALHLDEGTPHIHERHVFDCENKYGEICPQQEKALEELGIALPKPDKPKGRNNNRKQTFDAICRTMLFDITRKYGLHLEEEPSYGGRDYLEKQDYILFKQKEQMKNQTEILDTLTLKIEEVEALIDEVSDIAYDKAVEVVTDEVRVETHKEDIRLVGGQGVGKSTFFRFMAVKDDWFTDDIGKLDSEKVYCQLRGHWMIEMSEMVATARSKSIEETKSFLSRQKETYRDSYAVYALDRPRQCVFGGTSNIKRFLPFDRTGNRRFVPVQTNRAEMEVHILENEKESRQYIDQVWAEAMMLYRNGNFKLAFSKETETQLDKLRQEFMADDTEAGMIQAWLDEHEDRKVCSLMLFKEALDNPYVKPKKAETDRICEIMNTSIVGWKQGTMTRFKDYGTQRSWVCVNENCKRDAKDLKNENDWHPVTEEEARQMELSFQ